MKKLVDTLSDAELREIERVYCQRKFFNFVKRAWRVVEPAAEFKTGWHIEAICDHLEAVTRGDIRRLLMCVPPGSMKSLLTAVFWPAWIWGPNEQPHFRTLAASHSERLAVRDNMRCRRLITSDWYKKLWPEVVLTGDQNEKRKFENKFTGFREAMPFKSLTGSRGDTVLIDDPHSVDSAESDAERISAVQTFRESVPTRLNDPEKSSIVVIMQRLHHKDVAGEIIDGDMGYEKLILPMEFEESTRCRTSIGFVDPREHEGELMFPSRFPQDVVDQLKKDLGSYAWAAQGQQRPTPREGGMFKPEWFRTVDVLPAGARAKRVRRWDIAGSIPKHGSQPDYTAGLLMSELDGVYYIEDVSRFRESAAKLEANIKSKASQDGRQTKIVVPQDPGAAGKNYAATLIKMLVGYNARAVIESGSKVQRATAFSAQCEAGNVILLRGAWNEAFLHELSTFPNGSNDDQVDAAAGAFNDLALTGTYNLGNVA